MRRTALVAALLLATAACSGTDDPRATDTAAPERSGDVDVEIVDFVFTPATLEVAVGAEVTWMNQDSFAHTVTAGTPDAPTGLFDADLGDRTAAGNAGSTYTFTFTEPGTYAYFCDLHPSMTAEVVVTG